MKRCEQLEDGEGTYGKTKRDPFTGHMSKIKRRLETKLVEGDRINKKYIYKQMTKTQLIELCVQARVCGGTMNEMVENLSSDKPPNRITNYFGPK